MDHRLRHFVLVYAFILHYVCFLFLFANVYNASFVGEYANSRRSRGKYNIKSRVPAQVTHLRRIIELSDTACVLNLRMTRNALGTLCYLLEHSGRLSHSRNVRIEEKVVMFLSILAHHKKVRVIGHDFQRSGETVSKHFHEVLAAVLALHKLLLVTPKDVDESCLDDKWKYFKGCIGALDGTYVDVRVKLSEKARYRNRKYDISVNVLGACDRDMKFTYVLPGWEGSAADSRVLRDALSRPHGLRIPKGCYYLCDNGYTNGEGFLTPYRGVRYHLKEWGPGTNMPQNSAEYFNMKHSRARNVIERCFELLKMRWAMLRSPTYYPIQTQNRIIMSCALLHNYIRTLMSVDPMEALLAPTFTNDDGDENDYIESVQPSAAWSNFRDNLSISMYNVILEFTLCGCTINKL